MAIEAERKWLIKSPKSWALIADLFDNLIDVKRIEQTYLIPDENKQSARIRKTIEGLTGDTNVVYHYNIKNFIEKGVNKEFEKEISKKQYEKLLKNARPDQKEIAKTRFLFKYNNQIFELDLFKRDLNGLAILELELNNINDKVQLPPFLSIIKEVTGDKKYSNFTLASRL